MQEMSLFGPFQLNDCRFGRYAFEIWLDIHIWHFVYWKEDLGDAFKSLHLTIVNLLHKSCICRC